MKIWLLIHPDAGLDNVVRVSTTRRKCIEKYTDSEVIPQSEEEANAFAIEHNLIFVEKEFYD